MSNEVKLAKLIKVDDKKSITEDDSIKRLSSFKESHKSKVEQWLANNENLNQSRKVSEKLKIDPRQRLQSEKQRSQSKENKEIFDDSKKKVEKWLSANNLNTINDNDKINNKITDKKHDAIRNSNKDLVKSTTSLNNDKLKNFDQNVVNDKDIKIHKRSQSKDGNIGNKIKLEKQLSMNLDTRPKFLGSSNNNESIKELTKSKSSEKNEQTPAKIERHEIEIKRVPSVILNNDSQIINKSNNDEKNKSYDDSVNITDNLSKKNEPVENSKKVEEIYKKLEQVDSIQINLTFEPDDTKIESSVHRESTVKDIEKHSITPEIISSTTDKDSKELIKESISDQTKEDDKDIIEKAISSTAKQHILQNWLKDYRRLASKSPSVQKKRNKPDNQNQESKDTEKKYSKKEVELKRKKSKTYQRKIKILSIVLVFVAIAILAVTLGLLLKYLVFDSNTTVNQSPCKNICNTGYNSTYSNGKCTCFDMNECLSPLTNNCTGIGMSCQNLVGTYTCLCKTGFVLNNGKCYDINECENAICNPTETTGCINLLGSYECSCYKGFRWESSLKKCVDINECIDNNATALSNICEQNKICLNKIGSYECNCPIGYTIKLIDNQIICTDIDECKSSNSLNYKCPYPYFCSNTEGSYKCCRNDTSICQTCGLQFITPLSRIIGGNTALKNSWPWMVSIGINYQYSFYSSLFQADVVQWINITHICGGVLISNRYVLTAAHCFYQLTVPTYMNDKIPVKPNQFHNTFEDILTVYVGIQDQRIDKLYSENIYKVEKIYLHEQYDSVNYLNDIAIIRLTEPIQKSIKTDWICLLDTSMNINLINSKVYAIGFGVTVPNSNELSNTLQQVDLFIYPFSTCSIATIGVLTDEKSQICAGNLNSGEDTCQGDSGSPIMYNYNGVWYTIGIVSYGKGCAVNDYAGIYTNVTYFKNWINSKIF